MIKATLDRNAFWRARTPGSTKQDRALVDGSRACLMRSREVLKRCRPTGRFPPELRLKSIRPKSPS